MTILLNNHGGDNQAWAEGLAQYLPELDVHIYPDIPNADEIEYAVVWHHPHGDLLNYPKLKAILVLGAGMDHIDQEPELPNVPIVRLLDPTVGDEMSQYVLYWLMHFQRGYERYREQSQEKHWQRYATPLSREVKVTVLGAGLIGSFIAERLALNGFAAQCWSRSERQIEGVKMYVGERGFEHAMSETDVLVNCLPLNKHTTGFLNQQRLAILPKGASLINVSRGAVIDDNALLNLLESGHIANAALDTFITEPLPQTSKYWQTKNVYITPHMSGSTYPRLSCEVIANNIKRLERGEAPFPIYVRPSS